MDGIQIELAYSNTGAVLGWRVTAGTDVSIVPASAPALIDKPAFEEPAEYHVMYSARPEV
jgi:hypothetical protein